MKIRTFLHYFSLWRHKKNRVGEVNRRSPPTNDAQLFWNIVAADFEQGSEISGNSSDSEYSRSTSSASHTSQTL